MLPRVTYPTAWLMKSSRLLAALLLAASSVCSALPALQRLPAIHTTDDGQRFQVEVIARGLQVPWDMKFTLAGELIITQRIGQLLLLNPAGELRELDQLPQVMAKGESGLMGLVLHAVSRDQQFIYLCYSVRQGIFGVRNMLTRSLLGRFGLLQEAELMSWPGDRFHNGCQLAIGPDQKLYVSTGDATDGDQAQDPDSLLGKILRLNLDGSVPTDNPWPGSPNYSMGHRNPQGFDWLPHPPMLYAVEHGPSSFDGPRGGDELNQIKPGANYGWPVVSHHQTQADMVNPVMLWEQSIAPASLVVYTGSKLPNMKNNLFITALAGKSLVRIVLDDRGDPVSREALLQDQFGRLRAMTQGPDGYLYFATSNHDGRGEPGPEDDRLLRLVPLH